MFQMIGIFCAVQLFAFSSGIAHADQSVYELEERQIPKNPSQPPSLRQRPARDSHHCERFFVFDGKKEECDSNLGHDAERLRPLMHDVPSALEELDLYQENLKKIKTAAYVGTAGILAMIVGVIMSRPPFDPNSGAARPGAYVMMVGLAAGVNSMIYGFSLVKTNEAHLGNAVQYYNAAHPDRAIELQFSTNVNF
jgi:hypothetical protein